MIDYSVIVAALLAAVAVFAAFVAGRDFRFALGTALFFASGSSVLAFLLLSPPFLFEFFRIGELAVPTFVINVLSWNEVFGVMFGSNTV